MTTNTQTPTTIASASAAANNWLNPEVIDQLKSALGNFVAMDWKDGVPMLGAIIGDAAVSKASAKAIVDDVFPDAPKQSKTALRTALMFGNDAAATTKLVADLKDEKDGDKPAITASWSVLMGYIADQRDSGATADSIVNQIRVTYGRKGQDHENLVAINSGAKALGKLRDALAGLVETGHTSEDDADMADQAVKNLIAALSVFPKPSK